MLDFSHEAKTLLSPTQSPMRDGAAPRASSYQQFCMFRRKARSLIAPQLQKTAADELGRKKIEKGEAAELKLKNKVLLQIVSPHFSSFSYSTNN